MLVRLELDPEKELELSLLTLIRSPKAQPASQPSSIHSTLVDMQSILLGTDVHTALLTQSHVTEGHITRRLPVQH